MITALRRDARRSKPLKVVLGSGETHFDGWLATDQHVLDVRVPEDWAALFDEHSIDRLLAEHLFEHLSEDECLASFLLCYRYLKPGGRLRVAVPDGLRPDPEYIEEVVPPRDGHQCLFHVDTLSALLAAAGFRTEPVEYFDIEGQFQARPWSAADGHIHRSVARDRMDDGGELGYTSLIVDALKD
jgi:predicted SAM-dependent methyltransferase